MEVASDWRVNRPVTPRQIVIGEIQRICDQEILFTLFLSFYHLLDQHVMYMNRRDNCYVNAMAQMMFNCHRINDFASSITGMGDHEMEKGKMCYTCQLAEEYFNRTPTPKTPILCTWSTTTFIQGLEERQRFGAYGDLGDIIKYLFKAIDRDTKKCHKWLAPKLSKFLQMHSKSKISRRMPGFTYIDHEETGLSFDDRCKRYLERINNRHPRVIMVEYIRTTTIGCVE